MNEVGSIHTLFFFFCTDFKFLEGLLLFEKPETQLL